MEIGPLLDDGLKRGTPKALKVPLCFSVSLFECLLEILIFLPFYVVLAVFRVFSVCERATGHTF